MIDLTPVAAEKLRGLRAADPSRAVLRVYVNGRSCCGVNYGLAFDDAAAEDDARIERAGIPLVVDPDSVPLVRGSTIDFVDALTGGGFVVRNPAIDSGGGCACGRR